MGVQTLDLNTENLIAGEIRSAEKAAAAATYKRGQLLGRTDSTGVYGAYLGTGTIGLQNVRAICAQDIILASAGRLPVYVAGSEINSAGIVDAAGASVTVTSAMVESAQDSAILIK